MSPALDQERIAKAVHEAADGAVREALRQALIELDLHDPLAAGAMLKRLEASRRRFDEEAGW